MTKAKREKVPHSNCTHFIIATMMKEYSGQPKFSYRPRVHKTIEQARSEKERLESICTESIFGIYGFIEQTKKQR